VEEAKAAGKAPDAVYCRALLDATGICTVPGSGFHQVDGTFHLRTTFLPPEDQIEVFATKIGTFHESYMAKFK
jgi:aspartate/methionine/tyrosine aminotransferase